MIDRPDADEQRDADHLAHLKTKPGRRHGQSGSVRLSQLLASWLGAFVGIGVLALIVEGLPSLQLLVIGSFGASAVLLFGAPKAPFSQPRNLIGGHLVSAIIGVLCYRYLPNLEILQEAAAVASAIALMQVTRTMHPPGGATALIAVIGGSSVHAMGWGYVFIVLFGAGIMLLVALISNNLYEAGSYPQHWD
jgi:CBS-domain-containing membrane protein